MTCTLVLMRHAKSDWSEEDLSDFERQLSPRGRSSATAMGDWLRDRGHLPDAAIVSGAQRTRETFERLRFDIPVTFTRDLYLASQDRMFAALKTMTEPTVLMVGHNPGIAELAEHLVQTTPDHPQFHRYPTGATLVIRWDSKRWNEIGWRKGQPIDFAVPREVIG